MTLPFVFGKHRRGDSRIARGRILMRPYTLKTVSLRAYLYVIVRRTKSDVAISINVASV